MGELPGIGRYTAGAIASIAWDAREPILEANTIRLYSRLIAYRDDPSRSEGQRTLWMLAEHLLPRAACGEFNQALMELGSAICTPRDPQCPECPVDGTAHRTGRAPDDHQAWCHPLSHHARLPRGPLGRRPLGSHRSALGRTAPVGSVSAERHQPKNQPPDCQRIRSPLAAVETNVFRKANGVGSGFRATIVHMERQLPENDSRPLPQNPTLIHLPVLNVADVR